MSNLNGSIGTDNGAYRMHGRVDEVAVYGTALSPAVIGEHYALAGGQQLSPYAASVLDTGGLAGYWRLGEQSASSAFDELGLSDGTYTGAVSLGIAGAIPGDPNTAVSLDGTTGQIKVPSLGSASDWTVEG